MTGKRFIPDKRRAGREKHDSALELYDEKGARVECAATLSDLSETGASFRTAFVFAKGARLTVRLRLFGRGAVTASGRVVRVKEFNNYALYGFAFDAAPKPS